MSQIKVENSFWLFSLPLKHREIHEQRPEVIFQDRQILFTYLREKLVTADVCCLFPIDLPEFKVILALKNYLIINFEFYLDWYSRYISHFK